VAGQGGPSSRRIVTGNPVMILNSSTKSLRCIGSILPERAAAAFVIGEDHLADREDALGIEEHVLVRQRPMPSAPKRRAVRRPAAFPHWPGPSLRRDRIGQPSASRKSPGQLGLLGRTAPAITSPVEPSMVMMSPALKCRSRTRHRAFLIVDADFARARDARPAHAARDDRRMAGHAAARGQDALGGVHAVNVFRAGLDPAEDHFLAGLRMLSALSAWKTIFLRPHRARPAGLCTRRRDAPWGRSWDAAAGRAPSGRFA